jgi:hypothetical protein
VRVEGESLIFENDVRSPPRTVRSTGIGLVNLRERFRLATGREAAWAFEQDRFVVRLPLVRGAVAREP